MILQHMYLILTSGMQINSPMLDAWKDPKSLFAWMSIV